MPPKRSKKKPVDPALGPGSSDDSKVVAKTDPLSVAPAGAPPPAEAPQPAPAHAPATAQPTGAEPPAAAASPAGAAALAPSVPSPLPPVPSEEALLPTPETLATADLLGFSAMPGTAESGGAAEDLASSGVPEVEKPTATPRFKVGVVPLQRKIASTPDLLGSFMTDDGLLDLRNKSSFKLDVNSSASDHFFEQLVQGVTPAFRVQYNPRDDLIAEGVQAGCVTLTSHNRDLMGTGEHRVATRLQAEMRKPYDGPGTSDARWFNDLLSVEAGPAGEPPAVLAVAVASATAGGQIPRKVPSSMCVELGFRKTTPPTGSGTLLAAPLLVNTSRIALMRRSLEACKLFLIDETRFVANEIRNGRIHPDAMRFLDPYSGEDKSISNPELLRMRVFEVTDIPMNSPTGMVRRPAYLTQAAHFTIEDPKPPSLRFFTRSIREKSRSAGEEQASNLVSLPLQSGAEMMGASRRVSDFAAYARTLLSEHGVTLSRVLAQMALTGYRARIAITWPDSVNVIDNAYACFLTLLIIPADMLVYRDFVSLIAGVIAPIYNQEDQHYMGPGGVPVVASGYKTYAARFGTDYIAWIRAGRPAQFNPPQLDDPHVAMARIKSNPVRPDQVKVKLNMILRDIVNYGARFHALPPHYGSVAFYEPTIVGPVSTPFVPSVDLNGWLDPNAPGINGNRYSLYSHAQEAETLLLRLCTYVDLLGCMMGVGEGRGEIFISRVRDKAMQNQLSGSMASISACVAIGARIQGLTPYQPGTVTPDEEADDLVYTVPLGGAPALVFLGVTTKGETAETREKGYLPLAPVVPASIHRDDALYNLFTLMLYQRATVSRTGAPLPEIELHRLTPSIFTCVEDSLKVLFGSVQPSTRAQLEYVHTHRAEYRVNFDFPPALLRDDLLGILRPPGNADIYWKGVSPAADVRWSRRIQGFAAGAAPETVAYSAPLGNRFHPIFGHIIPSTPTATSFFSVPGAAPLMELMLGLDPPPPFTIFKSSMEALYVPVVDDRLHASLKDVPTFNPGGVAGWVELITLLTSVTSASAPSEKFFSDTELLKLLLTYNMVNNTNFRYIYIKAHAGLKLELVEPDRDIIAASPGFKVRQKDYDRGAFALELDSGTLTLPACIVPTTALMGGVAERTDLIPLLLTHISVGLSKIHSDPRLLHLPIAHPDRVGNCTTESHLSRRGPLTGVGFPVSTLVYVTGREEQLKLTDELKLRAPALMP